VIFFIVLPVMHRQAVFHPVFPLRLPDFHSEKNKHNQFVELEPRRGTIYDRYLKAQAFNLSLDSLYAAPNSIKDRDKEAIIDKLQPILGVDRVYLRDRLYRKRLLSGWRENCLPISPRQ